MWGSIGELGLALAGCVLLPVPLTCWGEPGGQISFDLQVEDSVARIERLLWSPEPQSVELSRRGDVYWLSFDGGPAASRLECCAAELVSDLARIECRGRHVSLELLGDDIHLVVDRRPGRSWYLVDVAAYRDAWADGFRRRLEAARWSEARDWISHLEETPGIGAFGVGDARARLHVAQGKELYRAGSYGEASRLFARALRERAYWTRDLETLQWLIASRGLEGDDAELLSLFSPVWSRWRERWERGDLTATERNALARILYFRARVARAVGDIETADEYLRQAGPHLGSGALGRAVRRDLGAPPEATGPERARLPATLDGHGTTPDLEARRLEGRPVLLHFWASWCVPCREEIPALLEFLDTDFSSLERRGLRFLTVTNDLRRADVDAYLSSVGGTFPTFFDARQEINRALGVEVLPATVLLDARGYVVETWGPLPWNDEIRQRLHESLDRGELDAGGLPR